MFMDAGSGSLSENYISAGSSRDLTVRPGRDDVEALVTVAWSRGKLGQALLQLMREWDGASRRGLRFDQAFLQMKALPEVRGALFLWAMGDAALPPRLEVLESADDLSWSVLMWFLDPACKTCSGTGWVTQKHAPKKPCTGCHGSRESRIPHGERGRAMVAHMESCVQRHRASARGRAGR